MGKEVKERRYIEVLTFKVVIELRETTPEGFAETASAGVYDEPDENFTFKMWFKIEEDPLGLKIIAHECWHLFMSIMNHVDKFEHTFEELNNEIYAYNFHKLVGDVLDALFSTKTYSRFLEKIN